jgi:hypothetical protein
MGIRKAQGAALPRAKIDPVRDQRHSPAARTGPGGSGERALTGWLRGDVASGQRGGGACEARITVRPGRGRSADRVGACPRTGHEGGARRPGRQPYRRGQAAFASCVDIAV